MICSSVDEIFEEPRGPCIEITNLRKSHAYSFYYVNLSNLIVQGFMPLILLALWNCGIHSSMRRSTERLKENLDASGRTKSEDDLARVLTGIVLTFLICHAFRIILNFHEALVIKHVQDCISIGKNGLALWTYVAMQFSNFFLVVNSSVNMIIYCWVNPNFRNKLLNGIMKPQVCMK